MHYLNSTIIDYIFANIISPANLKKSLANEKAVKITRNTNKETNLIKIVIGSSNPKRKIIIITANIAIVKIT